MNGGGLGISRTPGYFPVRIFFNLISIYQAPHFYLPDPELNTGILETNWTEFLTSG